MDQLQEAAEQQTLYVREEAEQIAAGIADYDEEGLLRLATHHAAMAGHWSSVVGVNVIPTAFLVSRMVGTVAGMRWWQMAQTGLLALILWRVW